MPFLVGIILRSALMVEHLPRVDASWSLDRRQFASAIYISSASSGAEAAWWKGIVFFDKRLCRGQNLRWILILPAICPSEVPSSRWALIASVLQLHSKASGGGIVVVGFFFFFVGGVAWLVGFEVLWMTLAK